MENRGEGLNLPNTEVRNRKTVLRMKNSFTLEKASGTEEDPDIEADDLFDLTVNIKEVGYKCDVCCKIFAKKYNLTAHQKALHSPCPKKHVCDVCGKEFAFKSNYNTHKYTHMDIPRNFKCSKCTSAFKNARGLKNHLKTHDTNKNYVCEVCGKKFTTTINLKNHMSAHSELRPHYCEMCRAAFKRSSHLQQHQKEVHGVHHTKMARNFSCEECNNSFTTNERLEIHKRKHTGELPFRCDKCWRRFASQMGLNVHHTMGECESKTSLCKVCNTEFKPGEEPCLHVKLKRNPLVIEKGSRSKKGKVLRKDKPRNFECELCGKAFIFNCDKKQHFKTCHTDERPFVCDECGKAFKAKNTLQNHQAVHSDSRPYPCSYCDKRFRRSEQLMLHTRTHTGEKPHICNFCGRGFAQIGDMKKHRKIHSRVL